MNTKLSVNINKIALLRNSRESNTPDLVEYAKKIIGYGAQGITIHPRPDQRHIKVSDIALIKNSIDVELNIEGNPFTTPLPSHRTNTADYPGFMQLIEEYQPEQTTLVPDLDHQLTSDHGFNIKENYHLLEPIVKKIKDLGSRVSIFLDPDIEQISLAHSMGADRVEFYTGPFAHEYKNNVSIAHYVDAAEHAHTIGMEINAGHDLSLENLSAFLEVAPHTKEVSIGHALISDALLYGLQTTIKKYLNCINNNLT